MHIKASRARMALAIESNAKLNWKGVEKLRRRDAIIKSYVCEKRQKFICFNPNSQRKKSFTSFSPQHINNNSTTSRVFHSKRKSHSYSFISHEGVESHSVRSLKAIHRLLFICHEDKSDLFISKARCATPTMRCESQCTGEISSLYDSFDSSDRSQECHQTTICDGDDVALDVSFASRLSAEQFRLWGVVNWKRREKTLKFLRKYSRGWRYCDNDSALKA